MEEGVDGTGSMNVLHYSSWNVRCGIADYTADLVGGLQSHGVNSTVVPVGLANDKSMRAADIVREYDDLAEQAGQYDLLHIQHEYSFFSGNSIHEANDNLARCLRRVLRNRTPVVVTFHSEPPKLLTVSRPPLGMQARAKLAVKQCVRSVIKFLRNPRERHSAIDMFRRNASLCRAIVHTRRTRLAKIGLGFAADQVSVVPMGCKTRSPNIHADMSEAKRRLNLPADCKLLSLFGFISKYKGPHVAARALRLLPPNYYLALVGGQHPHSNDTTLNHVLKIWHGRDPRRLRITGYQSESEIDLWQAATDISLAPYLEVGMSGSAGITWALSSGKPVIASRTLTFKEINDSANGMLLVTPNAPYELAWRIQQLAESPEHAAELVRNAQAYVAGHTWDKTAGRMLEVYQQFPTLHDRFAPSAQRYVFSMQCAMRDRSCAKVDYDRTAKLIPAQSKEIEHEN